MGIVWRFVVLFAAGAFLLGITGRSFVELLNNSHAVTAFGLACAVLAWLPATAQCSRAHLR